jgi:hypothetical protein
MSKANRNSKNRVNATIEGNSQKTTTTRFDKNTVDQTEQYRISKNKQTGKKSKTTTKEKDDKIRDPTAITINEQKKTAMGLNKRSRHDMEQATQLMPLPRNQTKETLAIKKASDIGDMYLGMENNTCYELFRMNMDMHKARQRHNFPLEELIEAQILIPNIMSLDERQNHEAKQSQVDILFVADQFVQLHHNAEDDKIGQSHLTNKLLKINREKENGGDEGYEGGGGGGGPNKKKRKKNQGESNVTVKLKTVFNRFEYSFSYESPDKGIDRADLNLKYSIDKANRLERLYMNDLIEKETPFCLAPKRYKMFRQLVECNIEKYRNRAKILQDATTSVPLTDLEEISREYITFYRQKPSDRDAQLCYNGQNCVCYTFSMDPLIRYIGLAFFTERQLEQKKRGEPLTHNAEGLCIDCLLREWTLKHANNISREHQPICAFNHFTVIVGEGQYNSDCMLQPYYNRRLTGIMGHVPRYDRKQREVIILNKRKLDRKGSVSLIHDNYIGESAEMDF